ncbi:hypothetical protein [Aquimarina sp. AU119]|uniref:hypothetical protein n=1 Tax=Aquimarina sp. AU119 TaxID=2108528 RepID=UPI000D69C301|nr:hypothetical protein [Aquimarina sp. AU119]
MKLLLKSQGIKYNSIESLCLNDEDFLKVIISKFDKINFVKSFKYFGVDGETKKEIKDFNSIKKQLKKISSKTYVISDGANESMLDLEVSFEKKRMSFYLIKTVKEESFTKFVAGFIKFFEIFYELFDDKLVFDIVSSISVLSMEYVEPRPPRVWKKFNPAGLIDIIVLPKEKDNMAKTQKIIQSLCFGELPPLVKRLKCNDKMFLINWLGEVNNTSEISEIISNRIIWYYKNSDFSIKSSYNEMGDEMVSIFNSSSTDYLTFYSQFNQKGYKGMIINELDEYNLKKIQELNEWMKQGKCPDGNPLSEINIIVPSREQAVNFNFLLQKFNINSILYASDDGKLWDPFPKGNWLN